MHRAAPLVLAVGACALLSCRGELGAPVSAASPRVEDKPHAPVEVLLDAEPEGGDRYRVTLEGRALAPLAGIEIELLLPPGATLVGGRRDARAGAVPAGGSLALEADIEVGGAAVLIGAARARLAGGAAGRAVELRVGGAPAAKREPAARVVITPFGPVAESGPGAGQR